MRIKQYQNAESIRTAFVPQKANSSRVLHPQTVELLFVGDVLRHIFQAAIQDRTQLVQRMCRYRHVGLEALDSRMTHAVFETQGIGRHLLFLHRFPQWRIVNHRLRPPLQLLLWLI